MHHDDRRTSRAGRWRSWAVTASASLALFVPLISPTTAGAAGTAITSSPPPDATVGAPYSHTFTADATDTTWSVTSGALPDGLTLDPSTGVLAGTPATSGASGPTTVTATWPGSLGALASGYYHNCTLLNGGAVDCWGSNTFGQSEDHSGPYTDVASGGYHNCALTPAGAADCWGYNHLGQATDQPGPYTAVGAGGNHSCGLTAAGAAECWGSNAFGQANPQAGPFTSLVVGPLHTCGLTAAGAADCWGYNNLGQATDQPGPYTAIALHMFHTCAVTSAGAVDCWGENTYGKAADQPGPYTAVANGFDHTCALTTAGALDCWGDNTYGQAPDQPGPYTLLATGGYNTCAVTAAWAVDCWGDNYSGAATNRAAGPGGSAEQTFSINVATPSGTISGTVTEDGTGTPLAGVAVRLLDGTTGVTTVITGTNGDYEFTAVPVGANYRVRFTDPTARHLVEYNGNSTKYSSTSPLSVTVLTTTDVDAALAVNSAVATITGQVTAAGSATPLAGITIQAYRNDVLVKSTNTDAGGEFLLSGLDPTGSWKVRYRDATGVYRGAYWNGQTSLATATGIALTAGAVTDADAALVAR